MVKFRESLKAGQIWKITNSRTASFGRKYKLIKTIEKTSLSHKGEFERAWEIFKINPRDNLEHTDGWEYECFIRKNGRRIG